MKIDHDTLRKSYRGYAALRRPPDRKKCPTPAAIAGSFEPSYSIRKKKRIIDHISACAGCQDEFMMFLQLKRSETTEGCATDPVAIEDGHSGRYKTRALGRLPLWQYACVLFGMCLAVYSYVLLSQQADSSGSRQTRERDIILISPKADRTISSSILFRWRQNSAAEYYIVELFDEQLLPVWISDIVRAPEMRLPPNVSSRLLPDRPYYWMVTGFAQDSKIGESHLTRFKMAR
jgi:hypothetical protein